MKPQQYKVSANYPGRDPWDDQPKEVSIDIASTGEAQAALDAVLQGLIPVEYLHSEWGAEPVFWTPELYTKGERWPEVIELSRSHVLLGFGDDNNPHTLELTVAEV